MSAETGSGVFIGLFVSGCMDVQWSVVQLTDNYSLGSGAETWLSFRQVLSQNLK